MRKLYIAVAVIVGTFAALLGTVALASRNGSGTYTLPAGNPVTTGTTISSTWANNTLADLQTEMTDSLSRSGKGGMLAPVRGLSGSSGAPTYSFTSETTSGIYRNALNDIRFAVGGSDVQQWTTAGTTITGTITTTSPVYAGNGSAAGPGFAFAGDTDNGLYRIGTNDWGLSVGGSGVAEMLSTGVKLLSSNPGSTTGFTNTLTPKNIAKAWWHGVSAGDTTNNVTTYGAFNVASADVVNGNAFVLEINLATGLSSTNDCAAVVSVVSISGAHFGVPNITCTSASKIRVAIYDVSAAGNLNFTTTATELNIVAYGAQ